MPPIRRIHQGRYGVSVPALTKDHKRNKDQYAVSRGLNTSYSRYGINIIFWKISNIVPALINPQYAVSNTWIRLGDLDNSTSNVLIPLDSWTSGLLVYRFPLSAYGISFKRKEFYITRHSAPSDHRAIKSHIKILSVVSLKTYSRYGYTYLKDIVLRRADYNEYKISESNFKNLHPNDFEDLYMLHLQGKLNHLYGSKKVHIFNAVNLWIRNTVIKKRVEDLQLGIESYQTKLNLTEPSWDATDFLFKEDYTIVHKPRAVIYKDRNDQKKMMRETKVHKFSDDTLTRILEKLDHMVKDFVLFKFNPGMEHIIWSKDDKRRSKEFIEVIERRLEIRRIFRNLESFVSRRLRDIDYRLITRT
ncbi:hypothetical protein Tco_0459336 [Tanacetum coccineum]